MLFHLLFCLLSCYACSGRLETMHTANMTTLMTNFAHYSLVPCALALYAVVTLLMTETLKNSYVLQA